MARSRFPFVCLLARTSTIPGLGPVPSLAIRSLSSALALSSLIPISSSASTRALPSGMTGVVWTAGVGWAGWAGAVAAMLATSLSVKSLTSKELDVSERKNFFARSSVS